MKFQIEPAAEFLSRTPRVVRAMLEGLSDEWIRANEGEDSWSPFDVLGHLNHGERTDWIPRARIILEEGEAKTFIPFDRFAQFEESRGKTLDELLDTFEKLRGENLKTLRSMSLQPEDFERKGVHPELGTVTLGELLATWVTHDQDHLVQILRTIAKQYKDEVGPWTEYISVLNR